MFLVNQTREIDGKYFEGGVEKKQAILFTKRECHMCTLLFLEFIKTDQNTYPQTLKN